MCADNRLLRLPLGDSEPAALSAARRRRRLQQEFTGNDTHVVDADIDAGHNTTAYQGDDDIHSPIYEGLEVWRRTP